jgi:hypothetical protein
MALFFLIGGCSSSSVRYGSGCRVGVERSRRRHQFRPGSLDPGAMAGVRIVGDPPIYRHRFILYCVAWIAIALGLRGA